MQECLCHNQTNQSNNMGILSRHKKELVKARTYYENIQSVNCPYFSESVTFNAKGIHHLQFSAGSERTKISQINKFNLLPKAVEILQKSGTLQQYRKQWGAVGQRKRRDGSRNVKEMQYFGFEGILGTNEKMLRVKVIVRQTGTGTPHFWSVMSDTDFKRKSNYKFASEDVIDG